MFHSKILWVKTKKRENLNPGHQFQASVTLSNPLHLPVVKERLSFHHVAETYDQNVHGSSTTETSSRSPIFVTTSLLNKKSESLPFKRKTTSVTRILTKFISSALKSSARKAVLVKTSLRLVSGIWSSLVPITSSGIWLSANCSRS